MRTKQFFKLIIVMFFLSITIGCKRTSEINNNDKIIRIENIQLKQIPDSTYTINFKDSNSIIFNKSLENSTTTISVQTFEEQKFSDEEKFLLFAENYIKNQMKPYEMKSLHFDVAGFKNTTCLKFDGTFRDSTNLDKNKEYLCHDGYLCLVPDDESKIAEIKVTHFSAERRMPKDAIYEYQAMIEQLKFTKD